MNVLALSSYFDRDGVTSKTLAEAAALAPLGVRMVVVVPCNPLARGEPAARLEEMGLAFHYAPTHYRVQGALFPWAFRRVGRLIRREKIDLLYVSHRKALVLAALLGRRHRVPVVFTVHGRSRGELPRRWTDFWLRRVARVLAVSEESAAFLGSRTRYPAERLSIVRNGVDAAHFAPRPGAAPRPAAGREFLFISRLDKDKMRSVDAVLEAAARAAREQPGLRLTVVGAGRKAGAVRRRVEAINAGLGRAAVSVAGWVEDPLEAMLRADAVLGAGRGVLEAAAAGREAVVAGNEWVGGRVTEESFRRLQRSNFSGRGAAGPAAAEALAAILSGPPPGAGETDKARALVLRDHDAARLAPEIKRLFEQAVREPVPPPWPGPWGRFRAAAGLFRLRAADRLRPGSAWDAVRDRSPLRLYAGNIPARPEYDGLVGLSLWKNDGRHIRHDIRRRHDRSEGSVDSYQAEDVFEHIDPAVIPAILADIHRILKPGGLFRLSLPDYRSDILADRCLRDREGGILFDPGGGGLLKRGRVVEGGHLWFPVFETVRDLLAASPFRDAFTFLHYHDEEGRAVLREIDYSRGFVRRTPDHDPRAREPRRPLSIVVDAVKR